MRASSILMPQLLKHSSQTTMHLPLICQRPAVFFAILLLCLGVVGCAGPAPNYSPSIDNVEALKKSGNQAARVGKFEAPAAMPGATSIGLRAFQMASPVGRDYGDYLSAALRQELELAKLYSPQSAFEISGKLVQNNINAGSMSSNYGQIEARFVVKRDAVVLFDKIKLATHQWESSFAGAVAIPLAANNYTVLVQKLLASLVADADFNAALHH